MSKIQKYAYGYRHVVFAAEHKHVMKVSLIAWLYDWFNLKRKLLLTLCILYKPDEFDTGIF